MAYRVVGSLRAALGESLTVIVLNKLLGPSAHMVLAIGLLLIAAAPYGYIRSSEPRLGLESMWPPHKCMSWMAIGECYGVLDSSNLSAILWTLMANDNGLGCLMWLPARVSL